MSEQTTATKEPRLPSLTTEELAAIEWLRCHCTVSTGPAFMPDDARQVRRILSAVDKLMASALSETKAPAWVSPKDRLPDVDGRLWAILAERRLNGGLIGFVPAYEYYHFDNGWATDDRVLFWLDVPLHPLPTVPHE